MIIYLYGPDSYRRNKKLRELTENYRKKNKEPDILAVDLEENPDDWVKVKDFLGQSSLFTRSKLCIVKNGGRIEEKGWKKTVRRALATETKTFLIFSDREKPLAAFGFLLKPPVQSQYFEELAEKKLDAFLKIEARARNLTFTPDAFRVLTEYVCSGSERSWRAVQALEKISLAKFPQPVLSRNLESIFEIGKHKKVYDVTARMLHEQNPQKKLELLENLFLQKEADDYIFNSLAFQAREKTNILRLAELDIAVKSGKLEPEQALADFCLYE